MSFHVGQEVVCIKKKPWVNHLLGITSADCDVPKFGDTLIVTDIKTESEIQFLFFGGKYIDWFDASGFRPAVKTNIEVFQAMLTPAPQEQVPA
jgi:hypothetical protein